MPLPSGFPSLLSSVFPKLIIPSQAPTTYITYIHTYITYIHTTTQIKPSIHPIKIYIHGCPPFNIFTRHLYCFILTYSTQSVHLQPPNLTFIPFSPFNLTPLQNCTNACGWCVLHYMPFASCRPSSSICTHGLQNFPTMHCQLGQLFCLQYATKFFQSKRIK